MSLRFLVLATAVMAAGPALAQDPGQDAYMTNCSACHQATGLGVKGAFPALAGDAFVRGFPGPVIGVVLKGRGGMPSFAADLTNEQIAAAITYVRGAWGNSAGAVTPADIARQRTQPANASPAGAQSH